MRKFVIAFAALAIAALFSFSAADNASAAEQLTYNQLPQIESTLGADNLGPPQVRPAVGLAGWIVAVEVGLL